MTATAFGKPLNILRDGVVVRKGSESRPLPLTGTQIDIDISGGLAVTRLTRKFSNAEAEPIEVLMTFPVGFHSVVTGLSARVGERRLVGKAQAKDRARQTYEDAIERGELAVLHEEPLRGLNALSIAPLPTGVEVEVCAEIVTPLSPMNNGLCLRLPMTIGDVYGDSPLLPADDILTQDGVKSPALLSVRADSGFAKLGDGRSLGSGPLSIELNQAIEIVLEGGAFGANRGRAANGNAVDLSLSPMEEGRAPLSCAILCDRSGSTQDEFPRSPLSVWGAIYNGLRAALRSLSDADEISLWQFDSDSACLGTARGAAAAERLVDLIEGPNGGTELIGAVCAAASRGAKQILVITDGRTWATQAPQEIDAAVHAVLVGADSLDAGVGYLAAQTGGEVFYASGAEAASAIAASLAGMRRGATRTRGTLVDGAPRQLECRRSGVDIRLQWSEASEGEGADAIGRFAAALALPLIADAKDAAAFAAAHDLCCPLTSLVLVDPFTKSAPALPHTIQQPLVARSVASSIMPMYAPDLDLQIKEAPMRAYRMDSTPSFLRAASQRRGLLDRLTSYEAPRETINWSHADAFLKGDFSALPKSIRERIERWARQPAVAEMAANYACDPTLFALALYTKKECENHRNAHRLAARVIGSLPMNAYIELVAGLETI